MSSIVSLALSPPIRFTHFSVLLLGLLTVGCSAGLHDSFVPVRFAENDANANANEHEHDNSNSGHDGGGSGGGGGTVLRTARPAGSGDSDEASLEASEEACSEHGCALLPPDREVLVCEPDQPTGPASDQPSARQAQLPRRPIVCLVNPTTGEIRLGSKESIRRLRSPSFVNLFASLSPLVPPTGHMSLHLQLNVLELPANLFAGVGQTIVEVRLLNVVAVHPDALIDLRRLRTFEIDTHQSPKQLSDRTSDGQTHHLDPATAFLRLRPLDGTAPIAFNLAVVCFRCPRLADPPPPFALRSAGDPMIVIGFPGQSSAEPQHAYTAVYPYSCPLATEHPGCPRGPHDSQVAAGVNRSLGNATLAELPPIGQEWRLNEETVVAVARVDGGDRTTGRSERTYFFTVLVLAVWCTLLTFCMLLVLAFILRRLRSNKSIQSPRLGSSKRAPGNWSDWTGWPNRWSRAGGWLDRLLVPTSRRRTSTLDEFPSASTGSAYLPSARPLGPLGNGTTASCLYPGLLGQLPRSNTLLVDSISASWHNAGLFPYAYPLGSMPNLALDGDDYDAEAEVEVETEAESGRPRTGQSGAGSRGTGRWSAGRRAGMPRRRPGVATQRNSATFLSPSTLPGFVATNAVRVHSVAAPSGPHEPGGLQRPQFGQSTTSGLVNTRPPSRTSQASLPIAAGANSVHRQTGSGQTVAVVTAPSPRDVRARLSEVYGAQFGQDERILLVVDDLLMGPSRRTGQTALRAEPEPEAEDSDGPSDDISESGIYENMQMSQQRVGLLQQRLVQG
ncbi:unnamed protein product [Protopolystoma xenopodis]|uniref:Cadherin domain-containing protein n=1 Tax=Protopolystoma xenopodis TaxID=117903 RepID=A0A3S4ZQI7_9PLAT|nr:unnamed protein product [Protopolystoma xenopodis]